MNRVARKVRTLIPGPRVGSWWTCDTCAENGLTSEIITTPGGPAPRCKNSDRHGFMRYRGGRYISDGTRPVEVNVEKAHDAE